MAGKDKINMNWAALLCITTASILLHIAASTPGPAQTQMTKGLISVILDNLKENSHSSPLTSTDWLSATQNGQGLLRVLAPSWNWTNLVWQTWQLSHKFISIYLKNLNMNHYILACLANLNWFYACWILFSDCSNRILRPYKIHQNSWQQAWAFDLHTLSHWT